MGASPVPVPAAGGGAGLLSPLPLREGVPDALHIARLADQPRHLGEASALDADVGKDEVDQWSLHAIAQRRIDDFVGVALRPPLPPPPLPLRPSTWRMRMPSIFSIGLTLSRTMPSIRSSSLAAEQRVARLVGEHVFGLIEQPLRLGFDRGTDTLGLGGNPRLLGLLLREQDLDGLAAFAISLSRAVMTRSAASVACIRAPSAAALAANSSSDFW